MLPAVRAALLRYFRHEVEAALRSLAVYTECIYNMDARFIWSEAKRESNLAKHKLDFVDVECVFDGGTFTVEDTRFWYGEKRYVTLGLLHHMPVYIVHTAYAEEIRAISFRKATRREAETYFKEVPH